MYVMIHLFLFLYVYYYYILYFIIKSNMVHHPFHHLHLHLLLLFVFAISLSTQQSTPFTATDMHLMYRVSSTTISPDHKYIVFSSKKWNNITGVSSANLMYTDISTQTTYNLTSFVEGRSDSSPQFSTLFPNYVLFMRNSAVFYKAFPPTESSQEIQLTSYPISLNDYKVKADSLVFSANVYFNCTTLQCSADQIAVQKTETYQTYDRLFMFHWDEWLPQGKGSHVFIQKLIYDKQTDTLMCNGEPRDLTLGMEINAPPHNTGSQHYDVSKDGTMVAFSGLLRNEKESWNTGWKTYYINVNEMTTPVVISGDIQARTQNPRFSKDQTQIAFLSMITPMLESENLHLVIYNILTNTLHDVSIDAIDKSITEFEWYKNNEILFVANSYQLDVLYKVNFADYSQPSYSLIKTATSTVSYSSLPVTIYNQKENFIISTKVAFDLPEQLVKLDLTTNEETVLVDLNKDITTRFNLSQAEMFTYQGAKQDNVYGWVLTPIDFDATRKYPGVFLIHGGPESSWTSGWSYRWNPQIWANQGYVVFMINPHGSTGFSSAYRDAVRNDWGGAPYEDIMNAFDHIERNYPYVDMDRLCACGGSYGGYMMNWLQGHTDKFKCLVNHDGAFSTISKFYSTDELWFQKAEFCPHDSTGCNPFDGETIRAGYEKNSPERYVKNWKTPMLVIEGGKDYRVPLTEALSTFTSLQLKGVESRFLYFPMENHWVLKPENSVKWNEEIIAWLDRFIKN